jgi:hypothetical protein
MRKRLTFVLTGAIIAALAIAATAAAVLTAPDGNTQEIAVSFKPKKLSKTVPTPVTLDVTTRTVSTTDPSGKPVPAVEAVIDFDKGASIQSKGYPTCAANKLENVSTEVGLEACKKAKIGGGTATALLPSSKGATPENLVVTAYNGKPQGSKPVVLLQAYGQVPVQVTQVLTGVVTKFNKEGFGPRLTIAIPLIAGGGGALTDFHATIFKKYNYKGKQVSYISAVCKTKKLKARGKFVYLDGQSLTPEVTGKCQQKPEQKKK